jgi:hypothetical protein
MDRRGFLKRGIQTGALLVSYPLWKQSRGREAEMLLTMDPVSAAALDKESLRKLLEACLSRGGDFAEVIREKRHEQPLPRRR